MKAAVLILVLASAAQAQLRLGYGARGEDRLTELGFLTGNMEIAENLRLQIVETILLRESPSQEDRCLKSYINLSRGNDLKIGIAYENLFVVGRDVNGETVDVNSRQSHSFHVTGQVWHFKASVGWNKATAEVLYPLFDKVLWINPRASTDKTVMLYLNINLPSRENQ